MYCKVYSCIKHNVIKYFQAPHRVYHMNVGDVHRFEEKLRATEKSLGVKEGEWLCITSGKYIKLIKYQFLPSNFRIWNWGTTKK